MNFADPQMKRIRLRSALQFDAPSYYICYYPLVDMYIRQMTGKSLLGLLPNADLRSVPILGIDSAGSEQHVFLANSAKLFADPPLIFALSRASSPSFAEGLARIHARLERDEPIIVSGTTYELPHAQDYHQPRFLDRHAPRGIDGAIGGAAIVDDHFIGVIGSSEEAVEVYDPVPNKFVGTLPLAAFESFWRGNVQFDVFKNAFGYAALVSFGTLEVQIADGYLREDLPAIARAVFRQVCSGFLEGRTRENYGRKYVSGVALGDWLREAFVTHHGQTGQAPSWMGKCLFDMRFARYYLRDGLQDVCQHLEMPLQAELTETLAIVDAWERVYKVFFGMTRRSANIDDEQARTFLAVVDEVLGREKALHQSFLAHLEQLG